MDNAHRKLSELTRLHNERRHLAGEVVDRTEQGLPTDQLEDQIEERRWASSTLLDEPPEATPSTMTGRNIAAFLFGAVFTVAVDMIPGVDPGDLAAAALRLDSLRTIEVSRSRTTPDTSVQTLEGRLLGGD